MENKLICIVEGKYNRLGVNEGDTVSLIEYNPNGTMRISLPTRGKTTVEQKDFVSYTVDEEKRYKLKTKIRRLYISHEFTPDYNYFEDEVDRLSRILVYGTPF